MPFQIQDGRNQGKYAGYQETHREQCEHEGRCFLTKHVTRVEKGEERSMILKVLVFTQGCDDEHRPCTQARQGQSQRDDPEDDSNYVHLSMPRVVMSYHWLKAGAR